jgi:hypothetical protein
MNTRAAVEECRCVCPLISARQQLGKDVLAATNNCWRRHFYAIHVVSKEVGGNVFLELFVVNSASKKKDILSYFIYILVSS